MTLTARLTWLLVAGIVGVPGSVGIAAEGTKEPPKLLGVSGRIRSVDASRGTLTLDRGPDSSGAAQPMELLINEETVVSKAGVRLMSADLQASDEEVRVRYTSHGSPPVARSVTFEKPGGLLRASGTIETVDLLKGELVLRPDGLFSGWQRRAFTVTEGTVISQGEQRSYLASSRPGDEVLIEYTKDGAKLMAYAVTVKTPRGRPAFQMRGRSPGIQRQMPGMPGSSSAKP